MEKEIIINAVRRAIRSSRMDLCDPGEFVRLVEIAEDELQNADSDPVSRARLHTLTAMGQLGPEIGLPDDDMCEALQGLIERYCDESDHEALIDLVTAFGCGWKRKPLVYDSGWSDLWSASFMCLVKCVHRICKSVYRSLKNDVHVQFPPGDELVDLEPAHDLTATVMSMMLVQPTSLIKIQHRLTITAGGSHEDPVYAGLEVTTDADWEEEIRTGAQAVYRCIEGGGRDADYKTEFKSGDIIRFRSAEAESNVLILQPFAGEEKYMKRHEKKPRAGAQLTFEGNMSLETFACTCGRIEHQKTDPDTGLKKGRKPCVQVHRLASWDPSAEIGALSNFLYIALRGEYAIGTDTVEEFSKSLLGRYWARHGWGSGARLRLAPVIHHVCQNDKCRQQDPDGGAREYMGDHCNRCNSAANDDTPIIVRDRLIVVDTETPLWVCGEYWRCGEKECRVPGLKNYKRTLIEPTTDRLKEAICSKCRGPFWSSYHRALLGAHLADSSTRLKGIRDADAELTDTCESCGSNEHDVVYCDLCKAHGRSGKLPQLPTWLFGPAGPLDCLQPTNDPDA